jgi:hypothetical protein
MFEKSIFNDFNYYLLDLSYQGNALKSKILVLQLRSITHIYTYGLQRFRLSL